MGSSGLKVRQQSALASPRTFKYAPPAISYSMLRWFLRYAQFYVARHMHAVRVRQEQHLERVCGRPLLAYMNHPSWWDPMIAAVLAASYFPDYSHYTPIDAAALEKYRFFKKLGFFGMTPGSFESQRRLLDVTAQVLAREHSVLWITPQARFSDVRQRPLQLGRGLPHLVRSAPNCVVLPIALEYSFWEESKPEVLVQFGEPYEAGDLLMRSSVQQALELSLERTLDELREAAVARDESAFRVILSGKSGVGGVYDLWRRGKAILMGRRFHPEHGGRLP